MMSSRTTVMPLVLFAPPAPPSDELLAAAGSWAWTAPARAPPGLRNVGNTCYLNAVVQALTHTPPLAVRSALASLLPVSRERVQDLALRQLHTSDCRASCAICSLSQRLYTALSPSTAPGPQTPTELLSNLPRGLTRGRQEDAHELLRLTVEALHHAGLRALGLSVHGAAAAPGARPPTVVERVFGGTLRSSVTCRACGHESATDDQFEDLSLELRGAGSVEAALGAFCATEALDDPQNLYRCSACKALTPADKRLRILHPPTVLVLHLKRFAPFYGKITRPIAFTERLSLQPHLVEGDAAYALYAVVVHSGFAASSGHYFTFARDAAGVWRCFDDSHVTPSSATAVLAAQAGAYMLFYQRVLPPPSPQPPMPAPAAAPDVLLPTPAQYLPPPPQEVPGRMEAGSPPATPPPLPSLLPESAPLLPVIALEAAPTPLPEPPSSALKRSRELVEEAGRATESRLICEAYRKMRAGPWAAEVRRELQMLAGSGGTKLAAAAACAAFKAGRPGAWALQGSLRVEDAFRAALARQAAAGMRLAEQGK